MEMHSSQLHPQDAQLTASYGLQYQQTVDLAAQAQFVRRTLTFSFQSSEFSRIQMAENSRLQVPDTSTVYKQQTPSTRIILVCIIKCTTTMQVSPIDVKRQTNPSKLGAIATLLFSRGCGFKTTAAAEKSLLSADSAMSQ
eukprot:6879-Heterococcus_DN1.PRE.2